VADVSSHAPGTFSWPELATIDQKAGVAFYRALFGWDLDDQPMGSGDTYSMFQMRGRPIGAAYTMRPQERQSGAPPHWNAYVTVANVDEAAKKAESLGAKVFAPPFDVTDSGRMAVLQDPTGAVFQVWQPNKHIGAMILNEPGALCWTELSTRDMQAAETFYTKLFGWIPKHSPAGSPMPYTEFNVGGTTGIGMMPMPEQVPAFAPSYWMPYFQVADADASAAKAKTLGANLIVPPHDIPNVGRFAVIADPQGAVFAVFTPKQG
jgi:hypothetical protein